jgi:pimeloyl-ACP methyl ester carboxylesterase
MSTARKASLAAAADGARSDVKTPRGRFAVLTAHPRKRSLPRGSVLLVPGFTGSKEDFAALLPLLASAGWSAASYDQRGQFESPCAPGDDLSLAGFASDALAVAATLFGTAERVHLVGHSFGGLVSATAAVAAPDVWASLTLLCSGPGGFEGDVSRELLEAARTLEQEPLESVYERLQARDRSLGRPAAPPEAERWLRSRFLANSAISLAAMTRHLADTPDLTAQLAALRLPVFVVRGERDDAWPHTLQDELADALGSTVVVIADAAHSPAVEQPEDTRDALVRLWMS